MSSVPDGAPQITKIGLSVVFEASITSRVSGSLNIATAPVIGHDHDVDVLVGEDRVDDDAPAFVGDRRAAAVDRVGDAQVRGDQPVVQGLLRRLGEVGEAQARVGEHVGDVRAGAARDRVHADARPLLPPRPCRRAVGPRARERGRHVEQLVEPADARHAELPEHRARDRVGAGEVAGVRLRHRRARLGLADLHHHHRLAQPGGVVGREHQRAAVLEALDVAGDHADLGLVGEVAGEVGELEVDLVAGRRPVREPDADLLALEHGPALVSRLRDQRDRRAFEVGAEVLERVQVRVRAEQVHIARPHEGLEPAFELLALLAGLGEAGREDHRELRLALQDFLERVDGASGEDDHEVEVAGDVEHRLVALVPEHRVVLRVHRIERGAVLARPRVELAGHRGVGLRRLLRRADQRDRFRVQERVEVDGAQLERSPGDVEFGEPEFGVGMRAPGGQRP